MPNPKFRLPFLLTSLLTAVVIGLGAVSNRDVKSLAFASQEKFTTVDEEKVPKASYVSALPSDPNERAVRSARNSRYDKRFSVPFDETSADTKKRSIISDWYLYVPALPIVESDAVVVGEVTASSGHLSNDKTGAYSEFVIRIDEVLKEDSGLSNEFVIAVREGADVELPSGRIVRYEIVHQGLPQVGRRYVLFLKYNEQGNDYDILTGYELRKERVLPLDKVQPFAIYKTQREDTFLDSVREAIARSFKNGGQHK